MSSRNKEITLVLDITAAVLAGAWMLVSLSTIFSLPPVKGDPPYSPHEYLTDRAMWALAFVCFVPAAWRLAAFVRRRRKARRSNQTQTEAVEG